MTLIAQPAAPAFKEKPRIALTEGLAIRVLYGWLHSQLLAAAPRYAPNGWWQCDLYAIARSHRATEYEVKVTRADFKADAEKAQLWFGDHKLGDRPITERHQERGYERRNKHELLAARDPRCPNRFYYVVPAGLLTAEEVPEWAGLIYLKPRANSGHWHFWGREIVRRAPQLHNVKLGQEHVDAINRTLGYRFWNLTLKGKEEPTP